MKTVLLVLAAAAANARADATIGVVVTGEEAPKAHAAAALGRWIADAGQRQVTTPLPPAALATMTDCFVVEEPECARTTVDKYATSDVVLYVSLVSKGDKVDVIAHRFEKGQPLQTARSTCEACTTEKLRVHLETMVRPMIAMKRLATTRPQDLTSSIGPPVRGHPDGLAVGAELGEPTSATVGWFFERFAVTAGFGTGVLAGAGLAIHIGGQVTVARAMPRMPLHVGLGVRHYRHGYDAMSLDEIPDSHTGVRVLAGVAFERGPLQFYAEAAPGIDIQRSRSCTLQSGPASICPHAQSSPWFVHVVVGLRWFVSHR